MNRTMNATMTTRDTQTITPRSRSCRSGWAGAIVDLIVDRLVGSGVLGWRLRDDFRSQVRSQSAKRPRLAGGRSGGSALGQHGQAASAWCLYTAWDDPRRDGSANLPGVTPKGLPAPGRRRRDRSCPTSTQATSEGALPRLDRHSRRSNATGGAVLHLGHEADEPDPPAVEAGQLVGRLKPGRGRAEELGERECGGIGGRHHDGQRGDCGSSTHLASPPWPAWPQVGEARKGGSPCRSEPATTSWRR